MSECKFKFYYHKGFVWKKHKFMSLASFYLISNILRINKFKKKVFCAALC